MIPPPPRFSTVIGPLRLPLPVGILRPSTVRLLFRKSTLPCIPQYLTVRFLPSPFTSILLLFTTACPLSASLFNGPALADSCPRELPSRSMHDVLSRPGRFDEANVFRGLITNTRMRKNKEEWNGAGKGENCGGGWGEGGVG